MNKFKLCNYYSDELDESVAVVLYSGDHGSLLLLPARDSDESDCLVLTEDDAGAHDKDSLCENGSWVNLENDIHPTLKKLIKEAKDFWKKNGGNKCPTCGK